MPEPSEKPKRAGQFSAESAKAAAAKRWEKARAASDDNAGDALAPSGPGAGKGSTKPDEERDRDLARREMRRMVRSATAKDADRVAAARILAGLDEAKAVTKPPSLDALDGLNASELEALVVAHL